MKRWAVTLVVGLAILVGNATAADKSDVSGLWQSRVGGQGWGQAAFALRINPQGRWSFASNGVLYPPFRSDPGEGAMDQSYRFHWQGYDATLGDVFVDAHFDSPTEIRGYVQSYAGIRPLFLRRDWGVGPGRSDAP